MENGNLGKPSIFGIVWSPGEQFDRIRQNPRFWGALIISTILTTVGMAMSAFGAPTEYWMQSAAGIPAEQAELIASSARIMMIVTGFFIPIFTILINSAIHLIITLIARADVKFKQLFSMNSYIMVIAGIGTLLNGLVHMAVGGDPEIGVTSLASIIDAEGALFGVLSSIEVFAIWGVVLTAMGLQQVGRLSKGWAWGVAIAFFVAGLILSAISMAFNAAIQGMGM